MEWDAPAIVPQTHKKTFKSIRQSKYWHSVTSTWKSPLKDRGWGWVVGYTNAICPKSLYPLRNRSHWKFSSSCNWQPGMRTVWDDGAFRVSLWVGSVTTHTSMVLAWVLTWEYCGLTRKLTFYAYNYVQAIPCEHPWALWPGLVNLFSLFKTSPPEQYYYLLFLTFLHPKLSDFINKTLG